MLKLPDVGVPNIGVVNVGLVNVNPAIVAAVPPRAMDVEPTVTELFVNAEFGTLTNLAFGKVPVVRKLASAAFALAVFACANAAFARVFNVFATADDGTVDILVEAMLELIEFEVKMGEYCVDASVLNTSRIDQALAVPVPTAVCNQEIDAFALSTPAAPTVL